MTRFARAKGSKASNERVPEEPTPWHEMKKQLELKYQNVDAAKKKNEADKKRSAAYNSFLKEQEKEQAKNVKWAEFPGIQKVSKKQQEKRKLKGLAKNRIMNGKGNTFKKNEKKGYNDDDILDESILDLEDEDDDAEFASLKMQIEEKLAKEEATTETIPLNRSSVIDDDETDEAPEEVSSKIAPKTLTATKTQNVNNKRVKNNAKNDTVRNKKQKLIQEINAPDQIKANTGIQPQKSKQLTNNNEEIQIVKKPVEELKENQKHTSEKKLSQSKLKSINQTNKIAELQNKPAETINEDEKLLLEKLKQKKLAQKERLKSLAAKRKEKWQQCCAKPLEEMTEDEQLFFEKIRQKRSALNKRKREFQAKKNADFQTNDDAEQKEKPATEKPLKMKPAAKVVKKDGMELAYFCKYLILKQDYDHIQELRKEMINRGIPHSQLNQALKQEGRRAQKRLAAMKKHVCFNCRKPGHQLSECPNISESQKEEMLGTGICFKCGSTEHTHLQCKIVKGQNYKFAQCFICKEQGHISRQCPDNNRGLYPKGGACKVCGDVTHLKKDCPTFQAKQEQNSVVVETIDDGNVEGLSKDEVKKIEAPKEKVNVVKF